MQDYEFSDLGPKESGDHQAVAHVHEVGASQVWRRFGETIVGTRELYAVDAITWGRREENILPCGQNICVGPVKGGWGKV